MSHKRTESQTEIFWHFRLKPDRRNGIFFHCRILQINQSKRRSSANTPGRIKRLIRLHRGITGLTRMDNHRTTIENVDDNSLFRIIATTKVWFNYFSLGENCHNVSGSTIYRQHDRPSTLSVSVSSIPLSIRPSVLLLNLNTPAKLT